jgi:hypothetical protein
MPESSDDTMTISQAFLDPGFHREDGGLAFFAVHMSFYFQRKDKGYGRSS